MKFYFLILVMTGCLNMYGQNQIIRRQHQLIYQFDNDVFEEVSSKRKCLYWNSKAIDSTGITVTSATTDGKSIIFYDSRPSGKTFYAVDHKGTLKKLFTSNIRSFELTAGQIFSSDEVWKNEDGVLEKDNGKNIIKYDKHTGEPSLFYRMDTLFQPEDPSELTNLVFLQSRKYLATICDLSIETLYCKYFLISPNGDSIKQIDFSSVDNSDTYQMHLIDEDEESVLIDISGGRPSENGHFIYTRNFQVVTQALEHGGGIVGRNFRNGHQISENKYSVLDDKHEVIFNYRYSLFLERSLFRMFANYLLLNEDVSRCSSDELELIKNMAFAKYNYKFQSEFYQAYFNAYRFYWKWQFSGLKHERQERKVSVDHLLTEMDRVNLKIVERYQKNLKR